MIHIKAGRYIKNIVRFAVVLGTLFLGPANVSAQLTFSTPINISTIPTQQVGGQQMAIDSQGNIFVLWTLVISGSSDVYFSRSTDGGVTFSPPQNISNCNCDPNFAYIALDGSGNIDVTWSPYPPVFGGGSNQLVFTRSTHKRVKQRESLVTI